VSEIRTVPRRCARCGEELPRRDFWVLPDGHYCKGCGGARRAEMKEEERASKDRARAVATGQGRLF
jgi:hypothetical protein